MDQGREASIVVVARAVRERLHELLGPDAAAMRAGLDVELRAQEIDVDALIGLLGSREETRRAMRDGLADLESSREGDSGYGPPPGLANPAAPIMYRCVECGFKYPVFEVGEPVPRSCPSGHERLERDR